MPCGGAIERRCSGHGLQGAGVFRRAADRQPAPRQLSRRHREVRRAAGQVRLHLLRRRPARHHPLWSGAGPEQLPKSDARGHRRLHRLRHRPEEAHRVQPEPGRRACRARLGIQLRRPPRLAQPHDPVQGEGGQGPRERLGRSLRLSDADGRRHSGLSRHPCARGRGPEAALGALARHRAEIQQRLRKVDPGARLRRRLLSRSPSR